MKISNLKNFLKIIFLILIISSIISCGEKKLKTDTNYSIEVAKVVGQATSGTIPPNAQITVRFVSPIVDKKETKKDLSSYILSFSPKINGKIQWKDERTLIFIPEKELPLNTKYSASLDLTKIVDAEKYPELKNFDFDFKTTNREITNLVGDF
ncbi:MAG: Ig-like domain-containing protein, partial [Candidatus Sericytochromatia bacterium]|nr:Ig-like domain-containing protein [Candidatus Sericytochromatia bacterium]